MKKVISPDLHQEGNPAREQSVTAACLRRPLPTQKEQSCVLVPSEDPGIGVGGAEEIVQLTKDLSCDMIASTHVKT